MNDLNTATASSAIAVLSTLADLEARDTAWLDVQNKQDDGPLIFNGQPVRIEVRSPGAREVLIIQHKQEQAQNARTFAAMRGKPSKETVDDKIAMGAEKLAAVTASIDGLPISPIELYKNPRMGYIAEQVQRFHADWANF